MKKYGVVHLPMLFLMLPNLIFVILFRFQSCTHVYKSGEAFKVFKLRVKMTIALTNEYQMYAQHPLSVALSSPQK